jgi:hypothetical protein
MECQFKGFDLRIGCRVGRRFAAMVASTSPGMVGKEQADPGSLEAFASPVNASLVTR